MQACMVRSFKNFKQWSLTRELLKQYLTEKQNSYLQTESGDGKWSLMRSGHCGRVDCKM